jgi:hypothetical protein
MSTMPYVSISKMWTYLQHQMDHGTAYGLGSKAPSLGADADSYDAIDCSGESRVLAYHGTNGALVLPDGSYTQHQWCIDQKLHTVDYRDIGKYGKGRLFIAFENPAPIGHVWLVDGTKLVTLESHGHAGPSSRPWDLCMFFSIVSACYEIPCIP